MGKIQKLQKRWEGMALSNVAFMEANGKHRIVNGYVAHAQPWLASLAPLTHPNIVVCGGTLIGSRYIMWVWPGVRGHGSKLLLL